MNVRSDRRPRRLLALALLLALLALVVPATAEAQQAEADILVAHAILAYDAGRYAEALDLLRQALAHEPDHVEALYYAGLAHLALQQPEAALAPLERAHGLAPADLAVQLQLGVASFVLKRDAQAERLLGRVFAEQPKTDGVGYYLGVVRYRRRDYRGALEAFRGGTSSDPEIQQLTRLYTGLTLAALGRREQALSEVDAALRLPSTSAVTSAAERLRDAVLTARAPVRPLQAEVRLGVYYDTNVAVLPEPSHDPAAERARRDHRHTLGELAYLRLDYAFMRHGPWEATASYSFFQTINQDLPEFNVQNHLGAVSGLYRGEAGDWPYQLGLAYAYDYFTLDDDEFVQRHTAGLLALLAAGPRHLSALQARLQVKEFSDDTRGTIDTAEVRDAHNWMVGLLHVLRFDGDRHLLRGGWQVDVEDAEGRNFSYLGHRFLVGGQYTLPWGGTRLRYDGDLHLRDYRHAHTLLPESRPRSRERHDRELTHVVRIEQPLPWSLTLIAEYQAIIARSNLPLYSFTRNLYTLNVSWQY